jgi:hypothetical protein
MYIESAHPENTGIHETVNKANALLEFSQMAGNQIKNLLKYWQGDGWMDNGRANNAFA